MTTINMDTTARLTSLKAKVAEADRLRAQAETTVTMAQKRLAEIDQQITALGVKPEEAEKVLGKLEIQLRKELDTIEAGLASEIAAYQAILAAAQ